MSEHVDLYDGHYGRLSAEVQAEVRRETWGEDLGQASWITAAEAREWFGLLALGPGRAALEIACGSGGVTCEMARATGAACTGVDVNPHGIAAATARAERDGLAGRVVFEVADAGARLPFPDASFDAVFCNDSINHLPDRPAVLRDWRRVLRPGGRALFTDPIVVTGQLTGAEMRERSSIGHFLFTPAGVNERLLAEAGFEVREARDVTGAVAEIARRWRDARERRRERLVALEGEDGFAGLQRFLGVAHALAAERRLSRIAYLAERTADGSPDR